MSNKKISLPQMDINWKCDSNSDACTLISAGGREPNNSWFKKLIEYNVGWDTYAVDKGLHYFLGNNVIPKYVIGDGDSAGLNTFEEAKSLGSNVMKYPVEKDDTDLQLALKKIDSNHLLITGIWGGRFDHLYSNVYSLANLKCNASRCIVMADEKEVMLLLGQRESVEIEIFNEKEIESISILPLSKATKVSIDGVHWPLKEQNLNMYIPYAISNILENGNNLSCSCFDGIFGLYFSFK